MPSPLRKKSHGLGGARGFSAAAFAGVTGYPSARRNDGLFVWALRDFSAAFDRFVAQRPEMRAARETAFFRR